MKRPLQRTPEILKRNIETTSQYITMKLREQARLQYMWTCAIWLDENGNLCVLDNDYAEQIEKVKAEIYQGQRTLIRFQEELKELRGEE